MFQHDVQHTGYSDSSAPENDAIAWSYDGAGNFSSPVVADLKVFVGSDDGNLYALNAVNGLLLWEFQAGD